MCGIYGSIGFPPEPQRIDIVAHRGPDGRGWQTFASAAGPVALGHRRLAIIDVSDAGLQPMADPTGRYAIVFNGEIYNYVELREDLKAKGEVFHTSSDTEVLLRAYAVWGEACLPRLRGMFALLIWDAHERTLFAARDRFGIKPLYMTTSGSRIAFGSEIKQLLGLDRAGNRMNIARVHDFLASGMSDHTGETLFDGITQLRGGECLTVKAGSAMLSTTMRRWYQVGATDVRMSRAHAAERFRDLLSDAVRVHLRSDVRIGSCLSGGLDSSSLVCLMAGMLPPPQKVDTVSACYSEKNVDEKPYMDAVVAHAGTMPHFIFPKADDVFQRASDITWHQDEPFGSTSIFAQWCVFEEAKRAGLKVMLDGQGADEQLAGYHPGFNFHIARLVREGQFVQAYRTIDARRRQLGTPVVSQLKHAAVPLLPRQVASVLRKKHRAVTAHDWLNSDLLQTKGNQSDALSTAAGLLGLAPPHDVRSLCLAMTFASNLQMLLHWEDRNSMAHSIEARVPFLDHPLVEFSLALGNDHKIDCGDTKVVLRDAMANILPTAVRDRRDKLGFATPEEAWFRGPLRGLIHDGVDATLKRYPSLLNTEGTRRLRDDMLAGRKAIDFSLWRIVNLGMWGERFSVTL